MFVGGLLGAIPWVELLTGLFYPLGLLGGLALAVLFMATVLGFHLMWPTIAVEGSDGFDALVIGVASIITVVYVVRAFQLIWWTPPAEGVKAKPGGDRLLAPVMLIGLCLLLGLWAEPLLRLANDVAAWLGDPAAYIAAVLGK